MGTFRSLSDKLVKSNLGPLDSLVHGKNIWALFNMKLSYTETGLKKKDCSNLHCCIFIIHVAVTRAV